MQMARSSKEGFCRPTSWLAGPHIKRCHNVKPSICKPKSGNSPVITVNFDVLHALLGLLQLYLGGLKTGGVPGSVDGLLY